MARLESQAVAGYYPTPAPLLTSLSSLLTWPEPRESWRRGSWHLLDPCAGDGEAIAGLRQRWWSGEAEVTVSACEMEATRAEALRERLTRWDHAHHADAFTLTWREGHGASLLFLNPPYDSDGGERFERRFLERFTPALAPGGALMLIVPARVLPELAPALARAYTDLRCWAFPPGFVEAFGQAVVVGRRSGLDAADADLEQRIARWGRLDDLEPLPAACPDPLAVDHGYHGLELVRVPFDLRGVAGSWRPFAEAGHTRLDAGELVGRRFETALPPKPAHVALALSAGHFNGHEMHPNRGERLPPILLKGTFTRGLAKVSERVNKEGEVTAEVAVERPVLHLEGLRLDTLEGFQPVPGAVPTGAGELEAMNVADVFERYSSSLTELMARQFPALHDPRDPGHQVELPELARRPYRVQAEAITAALKLLARGENAQMVAEVGTGKTTMALTVAAALEPRWRPQTLASLERTGVAAGRLPTVRRVLVVCPPHLLKSWTDQAAAVVPEARVITVESPADLAVDHPGLTFYLLSREKAKLGHGVAGLKACSRCGAWNGEEPETNARRRKRCEARRPRRALDAAARLAEDLAVALVPAFPKNGTVRSLVWRHRVLAHRCRRSPADAAIDPAAIARVRRRALDQLERAVSSEDGEWSVYHGWAAVVEALARGDAAEEATAKRLDEIAAAGPAGSWSAHRYAATAATSLRETPGEAGRRREELLEALRALVKLGTWEEWAEVPEDGWSHVHSRFRRPREAVCGEPLFQATAPRRVALARHVVRRMPKRFDLLVLDEFHEFANGKTAQGKAAHRLARLGLPTLALSGSVMGGYASSLFANMHALSRRFRDEYGVGEAGLFARQYGYLKVERKPKKDVEREYGAHSDREQRGVKVLGESPGILPSFLLRHLLPVGVVVHKADLDVELPPMREHRVPITAATETDEKRLAEYRRLQRAVLDAVRRDRFDAGRSGKLLGALVGVQAYLDHSTDDFEPFEVAYPESCGGEVIARGRSFPAAAPTAKESWLLDKLGEALAEDRRTLVFVRHVSAGLPERLRKLIRSELGEEAVWLRSDKVSPKRREAWIDQHVVAPNVKVLIVNPSSVRTGLNNLVGFSVGVWFEPEYSAWTYRQANGRLHRIGQTREVDVWVPYWSGTTQASAVELVAKKVTTSLQVDGLDLQGALESAGASDESRASAEAAMALGEAIYQRLTGGGLRGDYAEM